MKAYSLILICLLLFASSAFSQKATNRIKGHAYLEGLPNNYFEGLDIEFSGGDFYKLVEINTFGSYSVTVPDNWSGTVTPIICPESNITFDPPFYTYQNVSGTIEDQDFTALGAQLYTITGRITDSITGEPIANQEIKFDVETEDGGRPYNLTVDTDDNGNYTIVQFPCWNVTINPGLENYYITPFTHEYSQWDQNHINQDYSAYFYDFPVPDGWEYQISDKTHTISIRTSANPNVCGMEINIGDLIGLFYEDTASGELKCAGWNRWQDEHNIGLIAFGDDSYEPGQSGFISYPRQDQNWFVYSYSQNKTYTSWDVVFDPSYGTMNYFAVGGMQIVNELNGLYGNDIVIPTGWSGLSSFTEYSGNFPILTQVLDPISDELVILQTLDNMYYPGAGINQIFLWSSEKGYKIKLDGEAVLPMPGCPSGNTSFGLSTTWNIMPVFSACNVLATEIFNPIMDKVIVVKEIGGNKIFWPEMGIQTLQVLERGRAYFVAVSQNTSITYGDCQSYKSHPEPVESVLINHTPWNSPAETGYSHTFAFPAEVLQNVNSGDYIAAFNSAGTCVGMTQMEDPTVSLPLTVFGDDPTTTKIEGLQDGEEILFRLYSMMENEALDLQIAFDGNYVQNDGTFADNGLSVVSSLKVSSTGLSESDNALFEIFPNPAGNLVNIKMNDNETYLLSLQNINGQQVLSMSFTDAAKLDVAHLSRGVYFVEIIGQDTRSINKLVLK
jgi:hypothetical protein